MFKISILALIALTTTGCFGVKRAPDETRVVAGPRLSLPPEYGMVPPQTTGAATPAERAANAEVTAAQAALIGTEVMPQTPQTTEANWLLEGQDVDPQIRTKLTTDDIDAQETEAKKGFFDKLGDKLSGE